MIYIGGDVNKCDFLILQNEHINMWEICITQWTNIFKMTNALYYQILFIYLFIYSITVVPIFPHLPSSTQPTPFSYSQCPHCCPCLWVIHTCSLTNPLPFFPQLPFPCFPLAAVWLFLFSTSLVLFCSLVYFVH